MTVATFTPLAVTITAGALEGTALDLPGKLISRSYILVPTNTQKEK